MFLSKFRSDAGVSDRSPWGSFWFQPIGMRSSTGLRVTSGTAMRLSAVYSCVRVLAETFAILPFELYRRNEDGGREMVTDHWLYRLLAKAPNAWQTPFEWREMMMGHLALRGNGYNELVTDYKGEVVQLLPIHPDRIKPEMIGDGNYRWIISMPDGTTRILPRGAVWQIRGLSSDGITGLNPIEVAADVFGLGLAAQNYGARFFANDAKPGGWIEMAGKFADDNARKTWKESWAAAQSGKNRGKTAVLENGMKYNELKLNNTDAQFLESRKFSRSEIASIFRVPPHMIGDLDKATFSNIEQQSLEFVMHTMTPWAERWESSIQTFLMMEADEDLEVEFNFANILRGDSAARAVYYNKLFNMGALSPNDIRIREGDQPIANGNKYFVPLNMVSLELAGVPQAKKGVRPAANSDAEDNSADVRTVALAKAAAERVARKELQVVKVALKDPDPRAALTETYKQHAAYVVTCIGVTAELASAYCNARLGSALASHTPEPQFMAEAQLSIEKLILKGSL